MAHDVNANTNKKDADGANLYPLLESKDAGKYDAMVDSDGHAQTPPKEEKNDPTNDAVLNRCGCNVLYLYVFNYSLLMLFYMGQNVYNIGVIRTLERKFGLSSTQSGMIMAMNDISHILVVVFVGYFGKKAHKPRTMSLSLVLVGIAGLTMSSPHFMADNYPSAPGKTLETSIAHEKSVYYNGNENISLVNWTKHGEEVPYVLDPEQAESNAHGEFTTLDEDLALCGDSTNDTCNAEEIKRDSTNYAAFLTFMAAQFLSGLGGATITTLGYTYVDENSPKHKSALYIGILQAVFSLGTASGLGIASVALTLPENLESNPQYTPEDENWIGAWWLGYVLQGVCIIICCIPMWFFPKHILKPTVEEKKNEARPTIKQQLKEFPRSLMALFKNAAYVVNMIQNILLMYVISGIFINMPRYIEVHFMKPANKSSVVSINAVFAGLIGSLVGGFLMKRFKIGPFGASKMIVCSMCIGLLGILVAMNLGCPTLDVAGEWQDNGQLSVSTSCNANCSCSVNRMAYKPACGDDGLTYFSPCHAGCTQQDGEEFSECQCVAGPDGGYGGVSLGKCDVVCNLLIPYVIALFCFSLLGSVSRAPSIILEFRIVGDDQRAFALGVTSFAINLLGFVPSPLLYGTLIDSACILWQTTCSEGGTGSCLLYDSKVFRLVTHGTTLFFHVLALICATGVCLLVRRRKFATDTDETVTNVGDGVTSDDVESDVKEKEPLRGPSAAQ